MIIVLIILSEITLKFCQRLELGVISRYSLGYGHIPCRCARLALPAQDIHLFLCYFRQQNKWMWIFDTFSDSLVMPDRSNDTQNELHA